MVLNNLYDSLQITCHNLQTGTVCAGVESMCIVHARVCVCLSIHLPAFNKKIIELMEYLPFIHEKKNNNKIGEKLSLFFFVFVFLLRKIIN